MRDIDLVDADAEDLSTLKASLASRETFKRLGADYPSFLGTVTLTAEHSSDGRTVIHVHSAGVAGEPFATLLVEVDWARGHLVREYTVLLDPPLYNSQAQTNAAVAAPVAGATAQSGAVEHAAGATPNAAPDAAASAAATPAPTAPAPAPAPPTDNTAATASNTAPPSAGSATPDNSAAQSASAAPPTPPQTASNTEPSGNNAAASASTPEPTASTASAPKSESSSEPKSEASAEPKNNPSTEPKSSPSTEPTHADNYTVRAGDTLSSIAEQTYGADRKTRDRALVAIYRANPKAFHANMNVLYTGSALKLPGDSELEAIGPGEATQEVRQQYDSWRDDHGAARVASTGDNGHGQLRLVAPQEGAEQPAAPPAQSPSKPNAAGSSAGNSAATAALQQRVQQLESQLADSQRLLQMRSAELAALQARVQQEAANAHQPAASVTPPPSPPAANPSQPTTAPVSPPVLAPTPAPPPPVAQTPAPPVVPAAPAQSTTPPPAAAHPLQPHPVGASKRPHPAAPPPEGNSFVDVVLEHWYVPALVILLLIGGLAVRRWLRSREEDAFDRSLGELSPTDDESSPSRNDTLPVRTMTGLRQEPSYHVEESGEYQRPRFEQAGVSGPARSPEPVATEAPPPPPPAESPVALDQGDPLAEADFHMAYGLYDQAAELVQIAITRDPKRRDLKMKLLEVFFVWGNRERFLQTAHQLAESRDQGPAGEWEKILIMGRQIAAEDPLFADSRGLAGAGKVVDLNLEGGQNRVDFDLLGEPSLGTAATQESVELDLGAALGEPSATEATGEAPQIGHEDIVLDADDHSDATGTTREMPEAVSTNATTDMTALRPVPTGSGSTETMRIVAGGEPESPTVEQPQIRSGDQALRHKLDAHPGEQTAELAIDDLGLDLGALEGHADEPATVDPDAPTLLVDVDEDTRRMFEGAEAQAAQPPAAKPVEAQANDVTQRAAVAGRARPNATGTWMFTDTDFGAMAPSAKPSPTAVITQIQPQLQTGTTSTSLSAMHSSELDLDLSNLESLKGQPSNGLDLDVGSPGARAETPYTDTQKLKQNAALVSDDMALPDLEPVTLSEVGTKLDLARAYMDMGDPEGARSILAEVMSEGSMSQKQEARRLMDALPG